LWEWEGFSLWVFFSFSHKIECPLTKLYPIFQIGFHTSQKICPTFGISYRPLQVSLVVFFSVFGYFYYRAVVWLCFQFNNYYGILVPNKGNRTIGFDLNFFYGAFIWKFWEFPDQFLSGFQSSVAFRNKIFCHLFRIYDSFKNSFYWFLDLYRCLGYKFFHKV